MFAGDTHVFNSDRYICARQPQECQWRLRDIKCVCQWYSRFQLWLILTNSRFPVLLKCLLVSCQFSAYANRDTGMLKDNLVWMLHRCDCLRSWRKTSGQHKRFSVACQHILCCKNLSELEGSHVAEPKSSQTCCSLGDDWLVLWHSVHCSSKENAYHLPIESYMQALPSDSNGKVPTQLPSICNTTHSS